MTPTIINRFGTLTGWNNLTVNMLGRDLEGITALSYNDTVEKENAPGSGKYPVGRKVANYIAECTLTLYKEEADALDLSLPAGKRFQDIPAFDIIAEYAKEDGSIQKDIIHNCEFTNRGVETENAKGDIVMEYELIISHITWNAR